MGNIFKNAVINGMLTDIIVENGIISKLGKCSYKGYDLEGKRVIPGLVDIHIHGCSGFDTMDGNADKMADVLARHGTTAYLPTTMTAPIEKLHKITDIIPAHSGAKILGYHLEGPYISPNYSGAQNKAFMKKPDICEFSSFKNIKMVTVAPELDGAIEFISDCNCRISLGHTACDYNTAIKAFNNSADCLTHTFNAMAPLNHREPGPIAAAADANAFIQVICDGKHIHPSVIRMLYRLFGEDRIILISDAMPAAGLPDGEYTLGGDPCIVKNGVARTPDGALAGSTSFLLDCVKKAAEFGIPFDSAVKMASATPAKYLRLNCGEINVGYDADFVVLDSNLNTYKTVIGGEIFC